MKMNLLRSVMNPMIFFFGGGGGSLLSIFPVSCGISGNFQFSTHPNVNCHTLVHATTMGIPELHK